MDYLAHGLWSYIFFHKTRKPLYAVFFGLLPDNLSWALYLFYRIIMGQFGSGPPVVENIPTWFFTLYGISHSLIVFAFVCLMIYIISKKIPVYIYAWPIAILMDTLTHTREYLPTPFLWPISGWHFPGISWGSGWFMILNYALIACSLAYIYIKNNK